MTTVERPPLGALSLNTLHRSHSALEKHTLPKLKAIVPRAALTSITSKTPSTQTQTAMVKPSQYASHARKLKYTLKLAYYKLKTDQVGVPLSEIMKKHNATQHLKKVTGTIGGERFQPVPLTKKKLTTTPSLTRHISLLAASTPLHISGYAPIFPKKKVTFNRSNSYMDPSSTTTTTSSSSSTSTTAASVKKTSTTSTTTTKPTSSATSVSLPRITEYPSFKIDRKNLRTASSPQLSKTQPQHRSLRIEDLVDNRNNSAPLLSSATPIKRRQDENGDLLMSSPTKKLCSSTPASYGAAKSLLQLSALIGSN